MRIRNAARRLRPRQRRSGRTARAHPALTAADAQPLKQAGRATAGLQPRPSNGAAAAKLTAAAAAATGLVVTGARPLGPGCLHSCALRGPRMSCGPAAAPGKPWAAGGSDLGYLQLRYISARGATPRLWCLAGRNNACNSLQALAVWTRPALTDFDRPEVAAAQGYIIPTILCAGKPATLVSI